MRLREAERILSDYIELLAPACERVQVAGSIRRRKPDVKDAELVVIPRRIPREEAHKPLREYAQAMLIGATLDPIAPPVAAVTPRVPSQNLLLEVITATHRRGLVEIVKAGDKYQRIATPEGLEIDLWGCTADTWGAILLIRTGDRDFTNLMVTNQHQGGLMPYGMRQAQGTLWRKVTTDSNLHFPDGYEVVPTPTEESYLAALGFDPARTPRPQYRDFKAIQALRRTLPATTARR